MNGRIATVMVHTSPLDQPGIGDAGGMNIYVLESAQRMAAMGVSVDIFTYQYKSQQFQEIMSQQLGNYHYYVVMPHLIEEDDENLKCLKKNKQQAIF